MEKLVRLSFRSLIRTPWISLVNILGLAVAMLTAFFIFLWVRNELGYDNYHRKSARTYSVVAHYDMNKEQTWHWSTTPYPLAEHLKTISDVEATTRLNLPYPKGVVIWVGNRMFKESLVAAVDSNWFDIFDYKVVDGNVQDFEKDIYGLAISQSQADKFFGKLNCIGSQIRIDSTFYTVSMVFGNLPANTNFNYNFILSNRSLLSSAQKLNEANSWENFNYQTFFTSANPVDVKRIDEIIKRLPSVRSALASSKPSSFTLESESLAQLHFDEINPSYGPTDGNLTMIYVFSSLAIVILVLASVNYVNLNIAKAHERIKAISMRKLLGAGKAQIFFQFFTEAILTCLIATGIVLLVAIPLKDVFMKVTMTTGELKTLNFPVLLALAATFLLTTIFTGIYPSVLVASSRPLSGMRGDWMLGFSDNSVRTALVIFQFAVAIIFLTVTRAVNSQMAFINKHPLGYNKTNVFQVSIPASYRKTLSNQYIMDKLENNPYVEAAAFASGNIVDIKSTHSGSLDWDGRPPGFDPVVSQIKVSQNFNELFGLRLASGRWFLPHSIADYHNVVLNETAVKELHLLPPVVGRRFHFQGKKGEVIGVLNDFHFQSLNTGIEPLVIVNDDTWLNGLYIKAKVGFEGKAIASTESLWEEVISDSPFEYKFLDTAFAELYAKEDRVLDLFNFFSIVAVLISCFGLLSLVAFIVERRTKEVGLRKVMGASSLEIIWLISYDFMKMVVIAAAIAVPIAWFAIDEWLNIFAYKVENEPVFFIFGSLFTFGLAGILIAIQTLRVANQNPTTSLRTKE